MYLKPLLTDEMLLSLQLQYAILLTIVVTIQMKYILHIIDLRSENPWDNKAVYLLYTELITGNSVIKHLALLFFECGYHPRTNRNKEASSSP